LPKSSELHRRLRRLRSCPFNGAHGRMHIWLRNRVFISLQSYLLSWLLDFAL
jgi:hypothetical protein